jgi:hypothetical protein
MTLLPEPKPPISALPVIRVPVDIPSVGCPGAHGTSFIGEQFGNLPDIQSALHIKALKKAMEEQIYALIQGELPVLARAPIYAARAAQLIDYVASLVATLETVVNAVTAEVNAATAFINQKTAELNGAIAELESVPESARTATQRLALQRRQEYLGELDAQASRLATTLSCLAA